MDRLEIKVKVDPSDPAELDAAIKFLKALEGSKEKQLKAVKEDKAPQGEKTSAKPKKEKAQKQEEEPKDSPAEEEVTVEDVRASMSLKLADHKSEIVKRMKSYGAENLSSVPPGKLADFKEFIDQL